MTKRQRNDADMISRAYQGATGLVNEIEQTARVLFTGLTDLGLALNLLEATDEFGEETRADVEEAISDARLVSDRLAIRMEQLLTDIDIMRRGLKESTGTLRAGKGKIGAATGHLMETKETVANQVNLLASAAMIERSRDLLAANPEYFKRIARLIGITVARQLINELEQKETRPME